MYYNQALIFYTLAAFEYFLLRSVLVLQFVIMGAESNLSELLFGLDGMAG